MTSEHVSSSLAGQSYLVIEGEKSSLREEFKALWDYRELLFFLVSRTVRVKYKQTAIGVLWIVLQPLINMLILTLVFGYFVRIPINQNIPYTAFYFTTLVFWRYFASAIGAGGTSLIANTPLITKVYFPRMIIPLSSVLTPLVDFLLSFLFLVLFLPLVGITPTWRIIVVPLLIGQAFLTALAVSLWLSALNVRYRDVNYIIPFMVQIWMYLTPVIYPITLVPEQWRLIYSLNPMVGVVEGARWALLGMDTFQPTAMAVSLSVVLVLMAGGILYFNRTERYFADVI